MNPKQLRNQLARVANSKSGTSKIDYKEGWDACLANQEKFAPKRIKLLIRARQILRDLNLKLKTDLGDLRKEYQSQSERNFTYCKLLLAANDRIRALENQLKILRRVKK